MEFLAKDDLKVHSFERFIDESSQDFSGAIDSSERQAIALVKSKLASRYDVAAIFAQTGAGRHDLIIRILTFIVIYDIISRNAARKVPEDIKEMWEWAMSTLEAIRDRKESPKGLPPLTDDDGKPLRAAIWGNNSNENYYL